MSVQIQAGKLGYSKFVELPYEALVQKTKEALKGQGFGVLSEIDVQKTLKEKLGLDMPRCLILGACNPHLAHQAMTIEPEITLLLPCNVVVREVEGKLQVAMMDAMQMMEFVQNPKLKPIAEEAGKKLRAALSAI